MDPPTITPPIYTIQALAISLVVAFAFVVLRRLCRHSPDEWVRGARRWTAELEPCEVVGETKPPSSGSVRPAGAWTGWIEVIIGPMFSGKTTELIRRVRRYTLAGKRCVVLKNTRDTRYTKESVVVTHDKRNHRSLMRSDLMPALDELLASCDVVGIDEGQFFEDIVEFAEAAANAGKIVIVSSLDGTFGRQPFGRILELIPLAEFVTKLTAICMLCRAKEAAFSKRIGQSKDLILIGTADHYLAVCRQCYFTRVATLSESAEHSASDLHSNSSKPVTTEFS